MTFLGGGSGGGTRTYFEIDTPESSPSALDEEFDSSIGTWTDVNLGTATQNITTKPGALFVSLPGSFGSTCFAKLKALPAGDFTVITGLDITTKHSNYQYAGLIMSNSAVSGSGSQSFFAIVSESAQLKMYHQNFANWAYSSNGNITGEVPNFQGLPMRFLRITRSGSTYLAGASPDGSVWLQWGLTVGFTPTHIGLAFNNSGSLGLQTTMPFFRYAASATKQFGSLITI